MKTILRLLAILFCVASVGVKAADSDCVSDGGKTQCTKPLFGAWDFSYCRAGDYVLVWHSWCTARGGTWDSSIPGCIGGVTVTDDNFDGLASRAESIFTGCGMGTARQGWGITVDTICKTGSAGYINDQPVLEYDIAIVGPTAANSPCGSAQYTLQRQKPVTCPQGYELVTIPGKAWCIKAQPCETCVGNPVDVGNGEKRQREPDYQSPAAGGLEFARYYNSAGTFSPNAESSPSNDDFWRHTYSSRIVEMPGVTTILAAAQRYDGTVKYFNLDGSDLHNQPGGQYRLAKLTSGGVTTGWQITTPASDVEAYDAQGRLTTITTRSGFVTSLAYDANGRLQTVTDTFGRTITLGYDANGRLSTMTDPSSRNYQYAYDAQGRLSTVTYPNSTTRTYVYENAAWPFALTGIIDERGARFSTYGYDSTGRATLTEHAGYDNHFSLSFSKPYGTPTSDVIDAFNSAHTYTFTDIGGMRRLTQHAFTGRGTETRTYDAAGNLATLTDWRGIKTSYAYDLTRNLETSRTEADGTYWGATTPRTTATTWHPTYRLPATITRPSGLTGVNEVTTFTYDANGNLTKKNITASALVREWNYAVNARGQVLGIDGPRTDTTDVTTLTYYADNDVCTGCRGQVYTTTNAAGHVTTFNTYDADGRPTQITDANGVATTLAYHPRGWLASRSVAGVTFRRIGAGVFRRNGATELVG